MANTKETQAIQLYPVICSQCGEKSWYSMPPKGANTAFSGDCIAKLRNVQTIPELMHRQQ